MEDCWKKKGGSILFLDEPLSKYIGEKISRSFNINFGFNKVKELLNYFPYRYIERGQLTEFSKLYPGSQCSLIARIADINFQYMQTRKGFLIKLKLQEKNYSRFINSIFFNRYDLKNKFHIGDNAIFSGKVSIYEGKITLVHPYFEIHNNIFNIENIKNLIRKPIPVYSSKKRISTNVIEKNISSLIQSMPENLPDPLSDQILQEYKLPSLFKAYKNIHEGATIQECIVARSRMCFQEAFLVNILSMKSKFENNTNNAKIYKKLPNGIVSEFDNRLPFKLTSSQKKVSREIENDLASTRSMNRILQGDVGSGKTLVALRAILIVIESGGQAVFLVPTEALAIQHFKSISSLLFDYLQLNNIKISLLIGSVPTSKKKLIISEIASGQLNLIVSTHAIFAENITFSDLGLLIIDEQHRFGVNQRDILRKKNNCNYPHILSMTATPIPRSIAMTEFGYLDISIMKDSPKKKSSIATYCVNLSITPSWRNRIFERIKEEVTKGYQIYIVCPKIGDLEKDVGNEYNYTSVLSLSKEISQKLPNCNIEILHSRLNADIRQKIMENFAIGDIDILVTTTVIEVGIDVHNASMIVIMDAEYFGVSQLHQLRGRVGRGSIPGLCLLVTQNTDKQSLEKLKAVASTNDGFQLSLLDLQQRYEGDILSEKQSGKNKSLNLLSVTKHKQILSDAKIAATKLLKSDPSLKKNSDLIDMLNIFKYENNIDYLLKN